jgi:hypothetical protein
VTRRTDGGHGAVTLQAAFATLAAVASLAALGALAAAGGGKGVRSDWRAPVSPVIFPPQEIPLRFSHVQHLTEVGMTCEQCHQDATTSRSSLDNLIPPEAVCAGCHAIDRAQPNKEVAAGEPPARCDACHVGYDPASGAVPRVRIPPPNLKFSHAVHADQQIACSTCHGDFVADQVGLATRAQLPKMSLCLTCHDGTQAPAECITCHLAGPGGIVRTDFEQGRLIPSGVLRGDAHDMTFRTSHARVAQSDEKYCGNCHRPAFCVECHDGAIKPMDFHGNDYVSIHAIEARRNSPDCSACHRQQTFCVACHARSGVGADQRASDFVPGDPQRAYHPPGWTMAGHGMEARRNIRQCASCHREQFCVDCHSSQMGTVGVNPHPPGWAFSNRCESLRRKAARTCLRCHIDQAEVRCDRIGPP